MEIWIWLPKVVILKYNLLQHSTNSVPKQIPLLGLNFGVIFSLVYPIMLKYIHKFFDSLRGGDQFITYVS